MQRLKCQLPAYHQTPTFSPKPLQLLRRKSLQCPYQNLYPYLQMATELHRLVRAALCQWSWPLPLSPLSWRGWPQIHRLLRSHASAERRRSVSEGIGCVAAFQHMAIEDAAFVAPPLMQCMPILSVPGKVKMLFYR